MKQYLLLLLVLLLTTPLLLAQTPDAEVRIQAPEQALPGETIDVVVETTISDVRVISVPLRTRVTWPDGTQTTLSTQSDDEGLYRAQLYTPQQGTYQVTATATIGDNEFQTAHEVRVQRPQPNVTLQANQTHLLITGDQERSYEVRVQQPSPGPLTEAPVTCSATCATCEIECPVQDNLAYVTSQEDYWLLSAQEPTTLRVQPGQATNTTGWYEIRETSLASLPTSTVFTQDQRVINQQNRIVHIEVDQDDTPLVQPEIAYDTQTGSWYARYTGNQTGALKLNHTILGAWTLTGEPLNHTTSTIQTTEPFEARIQSSNQPPTLPNVTQNSYGTRVEYRQQALLRLHATNAVSLQGPKARIQTHQDANNNTVYYAQQTHLRLQATLTNDTFRLEQTQQAIQLNPPTNTTHTRVLDEQLRSVFSQPEAITNWQPRLPPGKYFVLYTTPDQTLAEPLELLTPGVLISTQENQTYQAQPNTQLTLTRTIRNTDSQNPRTIDIEVSSEYRVLLEDRAGNRLTDTNLNGVPDTGVLAPGEEFVLRAQVLLPPQASDDEVNWRFFSDEQEVRATDEIRVVTQQVLSGQEDLALTRIRPRADSITVEFYNFHDQPLQATLQLEYSTQAGSDSSQHSVNAPAGSSNETFSLPPNTYRVHAQLIIDDDNQENNQRTAYTATRPGPAIFVSEQRGVSHEAYRVRAQTPPGEYTAFYPLANGSFQETPATRLRNGDLLVQTPLPARTDFVIALAEGEPLALDAYEIIDNRDERVSTTGRWVEQSQVPGYYATNYLSDLDAGKGSKQVTYTPTTPGTYEVEIWHPGDAIFASNARVRIGDSTVLVNQKRPSEWRYLGRYDLGPERPVVIDNAASDGFVVADAIRLLRVDQYASSSLQLSATQQATPDKPLIYDSRGREVSSTVTLRRGGQAVRGGLLPRQARANNERFEVEFEFPETGPVRSLVVHDAVPSQMRVGVEPVGLSRAQQFTSRRVADSFAINPEFDSNYSFTRVATGRELLKCTDYDFDNQECLGGFEHVMYLEPGEEYTATLDPRDPLFVEVQEEVQVPFFASCSVGGSFSSDNCAGTYSHDPVCGDARVWCEDGHTETFGPVGRDATIGIRTTSGDINRDPVGQCDAIQEVLVYHLMWESGDNGLSYELKVDPDVSGFGGVLDSGALPTSAPGTFSVVDVTDDETWLCEHFFGDSPTARIEVTATRGGTGSQQNDYIMRVDYLVYAVSYNFTQDPITTDKNNYLQAEQVVISGDDIWDVDANVTINVSTAGSLVEQLNVTVNASNQFNTSFLLDNYAATGTYNISASQQNDSSINAQGSFNVNLRVPTITSERAGNFYNRSEIVKFSGSRWGRSLNVTVNGTGPEGEVLELIPSSNFTDSDGELEFSWQAPSDVGSLTGVYQFTFTEELDDSYSASENVTIVILPNYAQNNDALDQLQEIYERDSDYASFVENNNFAWLEVRFPEAMPVGATLNDLTLHFFHRQGSNAQAHEIDWFEPGVGWQSAVCNPPLTTSSQWDSCNLTALVDESDYFNQVRVRFTNANDAAWPQTPIFEYDIAYLDVDFTYPPPNVTLVSPANNSWFNTSTHDLSFEAQNAVFDIDACRLYVNEELEYTNDTFTNPGADTYSHTFLDGAHTWRVECADNSARELVGFSETWNINVDTQPPNLTLNNPVASGNYPFSSIDFNFTVTDNLDNLACDLIVNGAVEQSLTPGNDSAPTIVSVSGFIDGLHNYSVSCTDQANTVSSETREFLTDGADPIITFVAPTTIDGGAQRESWNYVNATVTDTNDAVGFVDFDRSVVLWMPFEDYGSGTSVADYSTYANDGTMVGTDIRRTRAGAFGSGIWIDDYSNSHRVEIPDSPELKLLSGGTLEAWVYQDPAATGDWRRIVCKETTTGNGGAWCMQVEGGGDLVRVSMDGNQENSNSAVPRGEWVHVAWTFDGVEWRWYINGVLDRAQTNALLPIDTSIPVYIGNSYGGPRGWEGGLDEVRIHNRALSPEEIRASYDAKINHVQANVTGLVEGMYLYNATTIDQGGRISSTETRTLFVDQTPPEVNITFPAVNDSWFNTSAPNMSFVLSDNLALETNYTLYLDGVVETSGAVVNNTEETYVFSGLTDGYYNATIEAFDHVLNFADNQTVTFFVDTTPPSITLNEPVDFFNTSDTSVLFNWTVTDALAGNTTCSLLIDDVVNVSGIVALNATPVTQSVGGFGDGNYNWSVSCSDFANNTAMSNTREFTVDTTPPVVTLESPLNETVFTTTRDVVLSYNVTDNLLPVTECRLYVDDELNQTDTSITQGVTQNFSVNNLSLGVYAWNVACVDLVGNAANSTQWEFEINISAQAISPANATVVDREETGRAPASIDLVANLTDRQSGVSVNFYASQTTPQTTGPVLLGSAVSNATGQATLTYNPNSTVFAGNYSWWPQAASYTNDTPRTYYVFGTPSIGFQDSLRDPNQEYNASQLVTINATVASQAESASDLQSLYGLLVNATLNQPDSTTHSTNLTGAGNLTGSYSLASDAQIGVWNVTLNTSAQWFFANETDGSRTFTVKGFANAISPLNGTVVDRDATGADLETVELVVRIPGATTGELVNFTADLVDPSFVGEDNLLLGQNTTNSSGHATLSFTPDTSYYAGTYEWRGESSVSYVNQIATLIIKGAASPARSSQDIDPLAEYNQSDVVQLRFNITSPKETQEELGLNYSLTTNVTMRPNATSTPTYTPTLIYDGADWIANQTIGLTDPVGVWYVQANTSGPYTYQNQSVEYFFTVFGLSNLTVASDSDVETKRVYELVNFTANFTDTSDQPILAATCEIRFNLTSGWTSYQAMSYGDELYYYSRTFNETYNSAAYNVACDEALYEAQNITATFTINRTAAHLLTAPGQVIDRDGAGPDPETLELVASIPQAPAGINLRFFTNLTDPVLGQTELFIASALTNSSGVASYTWNPNATIFAGNHTLYANATYADPGNLSDAQVVGALQATFSDALQNPNANYTQNQTATIQANTTSLPATPVQLNNSYELNYIAYFQSHNGADATTLSFLDPLWQASYALLDLAGVGVWNVSVNASAQYHYASADNRSFEVFGYLNVTETQPTSPQAYEYVPHTQTCTVQDQHSNAAVQAATVSFYRNSTFLGTNTTNATGQASITFTTNTSGVYDVLCNTTTDLSIYYYVGDQPFQTATLTVEPFLVTPTAPANGTAVDRDNVTATPDTITLNVSVIEEIPAGVTIYFYANLIDPVVAGQEELLLGTNQTTADNWAALTYKPNSSTYLGEYVWWAQGGDRGANGTRTFVQTGGLNATFASNTTNPDAEYDKPVNVTIDAALVSYGPENNSVLSSLYAASANNTFLIPNGSTDFITLPYNAVNWSGQYEVQIPDTRGWWTAQLAAAANYFTLVDGASRQFFVNNFPPTHTAPVLNSTTVNNYTNETLTLYNQSTTDAEGDVVRNIAEWFVDSQSITPILVPMSSANASGTRDYAHNSTFSILDGAYHNETGGPDGLGRFVFDGVDDALQDLSAGASLNGLEEFTISVWVKSDVTNTDNGILLGRSPNGNDDVFGLRYDEEGSVHGGINALKAGFRSTEGNFNIETSNNSQSTDWQHVVVRWTSGEQLEAFLDGTKDTPEGVSPAINGSITGADRLLVGRGAKYSVGTGWQGSISQLKIFNRSLSDQQIQLLYQEGQDASRNHQIASQETNVNERWHACLTPNDAFDDGERLCSNEVHIVGLLETLNPLNGTVVDRDGLGADSEIINLSVSSFGDAGVNVSFFADLTDPVYASQSDLLLGFALTNASGVATLSYDPNASIYAGNYTWRPEASNSATLDNRTYLVYGGLQVAYNSSLYNPNSSYNQTQTVSFVTNLTTPGPETSLEINNTQNFSFEQQLTLPNGSLVNVSASFVNPVFTSNYSLSPTAQVGVYNTSVFSSARFFYALSEQLRNFTVYGVSSVEVFDEQDLDNLTRWAGDYVEHYANWTHTDNTPVDAGLCTLTLWDGEQKNMSYQPSSELWVANHSYPFAGIFRYNATCERDFYYDVFGQNNVSIATNVSLVAEHTSQAVADDVQEVTLTVTNLQNHTEGNVSLYTIVDESQTPSYEQLPTFTQPVSGLHAGVVAEWNFPSIAPYAQEVIRFNVTGTNRWSTDYIIGVRTPPVSGEVFG